MAQTLVCVSAVSSQTEVCAAKLKGRSRINEIALFVSRLPGSRPEGGQWLLEEQAGETYAFVTFSACGPLGPCVTSNSTS